MRVLTSGIPLEGIESLKSAVEQAYAGLGVSVDVLSSENLEFSVRPAHERVSDLLVVLDSSSEDVCRDSCEKTLASSKYLHYVDAQSLVTELRARFPGIELDDPEDEQSLSSSGEVFEDSERSLMQGLIDNLRAQLEEQRALVSYSASIASESSSESAAGDAALLEENQRLRAALDSSESPLQQENIALRSELANRGKELDAARSQSGTIDEAKAEFAASTQTLRERVATLEESQSETLATLRKSDHHLQEARSRGTELQSALEAKESARLRAVEELETATRSLTALQTAQSSAKATITTLEAALAVEKEKNAGLAENKELQDKITGLVTAANEAESNLLESQQVNEELERRLSAAQADLSDSVTAARESSDSLVAANRTILEQRAKLHSLAAASQSPGDLTRDYEDVYGKLMKTQADPFFKIGSATFPEQLGSIDLVGVGKYSRVGFAFSAGGPSTRAMYKFLREEIRDIVNGSPLSTKSPLFAGMDPGKPFVIVDLNTESYIDYVFEVKRTRSGQEWISGGGGLTNYLSHTVLSKVSILSNGLKFFNEGYYLKVNWTTRLRELEESGYNIIVVGPNVTTLVGRILFDNFSKVGPSVLVTIGLGTDARNAYLGTKGLRVSDTDLVVIDPMADGKADAVYSALGKRFRSLLKIGSR